MLELSTAALLLILLVLLFLSAYFSSSETAMMALNRYRLSHLAEQNEPGARRAQRLLETPDRLIGLILTGNNFVNNAAATIVTIISTRLLGDSGPVVGAVTLTVFMLIFAETMPKTLGALHPERVAFSSAPILQALMWICYPIVWAVNMLANAVLYVFGIRVSGSAEMALSREELRTVLKEAGSLIPRKHREMLFGVLDLERVTVEDIMTPRGEIDALDLDLPPTELRDQLMMARHTRLPCYEGSIDNLLGILHMRKVMRLLAANEDISAAVLRPLLEEPYFIPNGTDLNKQLLHFQRRKQRMGIIVDEYGEIEGMLTLDDLLEEVVGEFTTHPQAFDLDIYHQADGTYLIDGTTPIREINRHCHWDLPESGPKTLNGLVLEQLESIPDQGTSLRVGDYVIEVTSVIDQAVRTARLCKVDDMPGNGNT
ncbi:MAG: HlyC/CorC family transporter [Gammaproteobacteria bacterium]|nr:HlyC/CorC family transporter [Gammaproteobacteria bacterium]